MAGIVRSGSWIKEGIESAVDGQAGNEIRVGPADLAKGTAEKNPAIGLDGQGTDRTVGDAKTWIKCRIQPAIPQQAANAASQDGIQLCEISRQEKSASRRAFNLFQRLRINRTVCLRGVAEG